MLEYLLYSILALLPSHFTFIHLTDKWLYVFSQMFLELSGIALKSLECYLSFEFHIIDELQCRDETFRFRRLFHSLFVKSMTLFKAHCFRNKGVCSAVWEPQYSKKDPPVIQVCSCYSRRRECEIK